MKIRNIIKNKQKIKADIAREEDTISKKIELIESTSVGMREGEYAVCARVINGDNVEGSWYKIFITSEQTG